MEWQADKFGPCDDYIVSPGRHVDGCMEADCFAQTAFDPVSDRRVAALLGNRQSEPCFRPAVNALVLFDQEMRATQFFSIAHSKKLGPLFQAARFFDLNITGQKIHIPAGGQGVKPKAWRGRDRGVLR